MFDGMNRMTCQCCRLTKIIINKNNHQSNERWHLHCPKEQHSIVLPLLSLEPIHTSSSPHQKKYHHQNEIEFRNTVLCTIILYHHYLDIHRCRDSIETTPCAAWCCSDRRFCRPSGITSILGRRSHPYNNDDDDDGSYIIDKWCRMDESCTQFSAIIGRHLHRFRQHY